ncbi:MAG: cupin domain-containing protein [Myxococcota bacterium]
MLATLDTLAGADLTPSFWAEFAGRHWERAPLVLRQPLAEPLIGSNALFGALRRAAQVFLNLKQQRHAPQFSRVRFFVDGAELLTDIAARLPGPTDHKSTDYFARLDDLLANRAGELVIHDLQEHSYELWSGLRRFLAGLYTHVGLPAAHADAVAILRTRGRNSFGLHRDDASVFMFVLEGHKRILLWPEQDMLGQEHLLATTQFEQLRQRAIVLEGKPGDVLYWPSTYWHVGDDDGAPSVSINLGLHLWPPSLPALSQLSQLARRHVREQLGATWPCNPHDLPASALAIPEAMRTSLRAARGLSRAPRLESYLQFHWLKRVTGAGFMRVPPMTPHRSLDDDDRLQTAQGEPTVRVSLSEGQTAFSAAGHAHVVPSSDALDRLFDRLNDGPTTVGSLLAACIRHSNPERERELRDVLERLLRYRALVLVSSQ